MANAVALCLFATTFIHTNIASRVVWQIVLPNREVKTALNAFNLTHFNNNCRKLKNNIKRNKIATFLRQIKEYTELYFVIKLPLALEVIKLNAFIWILIKTIFLNEIMLSIRKYYLFKTPV